MKKNANLNYKYHRKRSPQAKQLTQRRKRERAAKRFAQGKAS